MSEEYDLGTSFQNALIEDFFEKVEAADTGEDWAIVLTALGDGVGFKASIVVADVVLARASSPEPDKAVSTAIARAMAKMEELKERMAAAAADD